MSDHDPNLDFITDAEMRVQADLLVGDWFQGVTVLTNANGDLDAQITQAVAGLGLFIVITISEGQVPEIGGDEDWKCTIVVTENPLLNRGGETGKTARLTVQKIIKAAAGSTSIHLTNAAEVIAENGVVWQLTGIVRMALAPETST